MSEDLDLGFGGNDNDVDQNQIKDNADVTNLDTGKPDNDDIHDLDFQDNNVDQDDDIQHDTDDDNDDYNDDDYIGEVTYDDVKDYTIEYDGHQLSYDTNGNLIDENGNIFVESSDAYDFLESLDVDDGSELSIDSIQDALGFDIADDDGNILEFENSVDGIAQYINAAVETSRDEHVEAAINNLRQRIPILDDVINYYIFNNNSLEGFNENQIDYSEIEIDPEDENQQEAIIRMAWNAKSQKGDIDSYLNYLKTSGSLKSVAEEELEGMRQLSAENREEIERQAAEIEQERVNNMMEYWGGIKSIIDDRNIAGYQIPDRIIVNRDGYNYAATPDDFFDYLYLVDKDGHSAYENDLMNEPLENRIHEDLLKAYMKFVGGDYSNLVDMAMNKRDVNVLKMRSKNSRSKNAARIIKSNVSRGIDIDLDYN